ncbi:coiled-coil and C2 domain-containing protein 2A [Calliphora vicina]|uniref:coiled-coil and C2 domain-containing protein 2A n=1 Tax=Calliphora vicina TaxID=7373 RepID=UPI00325B400C
MSDYEAVAKRKKKLKTQKPKTTHVKPKQRQHNQKQKRKIQLTQEFEENEKEVMTLLENTSLFSESSNNSHRDEDNKSPSERFFCGTKEHQDIRSTTTANTIQEMDSEESQYEERLSKESMDDVSTTTRSIQPTLAATFIQIESEDTQTLVRQECSLYLTQQQQFVYKPKLQLETSLNSFSIQGQLDKNTILMLNRLIMEFKTRKEKIDKNMLKDFKNYHNFYNDDILYKTYCEYKFKPIFLEPSLESWAVPSKKLLTLYLKDLRFTEHPLLQEEHRLANTLELLYEHRQQRLKQKITEKLYADLQIERNILNELLTAAENVSRNDKSKEKRALKIEHHLYKVKALREKLYDEELSNKQLLQEILNSWVKLKHLRRQQEQHYTRLKLRIKIEDLHLAESKSRQRLWTQRFDTDLNEIYREQLEEYYRNKRLRQQHKAGGEYVAKPHKPDIGMVSSELREKFNKCFLNPKEPRVEVVRIFGNNGDYAELPGPRKLQSFFMRIFFDRQMVGETRICRLERDLSVVVNEKLGIMLNRRLPRDIRIKLYKKSKISSAQKIANIIVPLPLSTNIEPEPRTITITFSSHKQPISGYIRLNLETDEQFYPNEMVRKLFPAPQQHTTIPKNLLREWYERKLLTTPENGQAALLSSKSGSDTESDTEKLATALSETCTFQEDLLQFCEPSELENNPRLKVLHSRYLKNDVRTRDLKFIPMLDHELEFEWENTQQSVIDPGNWMDPIDLHKHEGKKYLKSLYEAIQNQCSRLTKVVESRENLLLNDEPISWAAFFQTIKLIFQPRLNLNADKNLSIGSSNPSLSLEYAQNFKIICNIVRATGIPVRITNPEDTDSRGRSTPESSNVFVLQNLKYSNVRPFIAVSYKDKFGRTMTAEGSNPTWNEQLILQLSGSLSDLHDDLRISLYDEVVENQMNDDPALKNMDIYQRIQNNWLGEYRIPINAILTQQKMDAVFELSSPKIIIGYKRPSLENITTNAETNIMIEQFPEIKESVRLWCFISLEPSFELPSVNTKCLECSELIEVRQHLGDWSFQALEMQPQRFMEPLVCTAEGKRLCVTRILQAIAPPIEASENLLDSACRFVSLLATPKFYDPCMRFTGIWLNNQLLLDTTWGSAKDLGVLLCNYLLYLGLQSSLVLGVAYPYGDCSFVFYTNEDSEMFFIDPCTGKRYALKDVFCPLQTIKMVITQNNFYLNIQTESRVSMMNFNWNDTSCWLPGFTKKNPAPLGGFQSLVYKYRLSDNISELKYNIERKIMKKISAWRTMRKTIWNRAFQPRLLTILQNMEQSVTFGSGSSYEELKYNNMLAAEFPNYKIFGFTLNFSYTNLNQISERIKTTGLHLNTNKNVEYSLAVHIHPYPNNILSVWLFLITIVPV